MARLILQNAELEHWLYGKITGVKVVNEVQIVGKISQTQISKDLEARTFTNYSFNDQNISSSNYSINVVNGVVYLAFV